ncbi:TetR/AcrR family transcriptional regulator [Actinophytocola xanthii]|uniref:TetR family transcriptional regulator n=1 Tax=Actinophytocola xanthii TaxID=1912961 RepID=A0A1Q8CX39_9PSEU|nr:TetR/AcrR family transcriptional regulator [Actinophytocola xanthii]OLF18915.1 TetR family transcriptional regulator [Actinophytocola xanthii]
MSGKRRRLPPADRREVILAAAATVFAEVGYDRAAMRAVATAAGVTTPVLYDHFASKADLYAALVSAQADDLITRWEEVGTQVAGGGGSTEDVFRSTVDAIFAWIEANPTGWRMVFLDAPSDPAVAQAHRARQERATAVLAEQFGRVAELRISVPLERRRADLLLAEAAKWTVNAIAAWWWDNRDLSRAQIVELTADLLWRGLAHITEE